ncbi:hypothetical protein [Streptomyces sp. NPDC006335]|uniref:hypothetical protein n=1 Tax=Streptomyces sp. NPDC006335 TaxID=3156895 RepID=UPI0033BCC986
MSAEDSRTVTDLEGNPVTEGAPVVAWRHDKKKFTATVKTIMPHRAGDGDFRRIVLVKDDDQEEVERHSDQLVVVVGDDETLPDTNLTAVVDARIHGGRDARIHGGRVCIMLSGRAGLQPVNVGQVPMDPFTRQVRDVLMAVPHVSGVAVVSTISNRQRNIVVHWEAGADRKVVGQRAWQAVAGVLPDVQLRRAFWQ